MKRRYPGLAIAVVGLAAVAAVGRSTAPAEVALFAAPPRAWMPHTADVDVLTEAWFCPGVPATGADGLEGALVIANRADVAMTGRAVLVNERAQNATVPIEIAPAGSLTIDLDATLPGQMVGAVVEFDAGTGVVEQVAINEVGTSRGACASAPSNEWYFADGFTVEGSRDQIVLMNPNDDLALATLTFATRDGARSPGPYSGLVIMPRSVRIIDLGAPGAGAQSEPELAVHVSSSQGRIVVGRSQTFFGGGRAGAQVSLGAPSLNNQWWFAGGQIAEGVREQYAIYNPTDDDVEVDPIFLGIATGASADPIDVPRGEVVIFDPATVEGLPQGRYAAVFSTLEAPSIVVERVTTTIRDGAAHATSVLLGATARPDGFLPGTWWSAAAPDVATNAALVIYNYDNAAGTVTVSALGPAGKVPVPGLVDVVLPPPSGVLTIDLVDPAAFGRPLVVESANRIFVERAFPSGSGDDRTSSWAIPQG